MPSKKGREFAALFSEFARNRGLSQFDFAREIGIAQSQISRFCNGQRRPSLQVVIRIWDLSMDEGVRIMDLLYPDMAIILARIYEKRPISALKTHA